MAETVDRPAQFPNYHPDTGTQATFGGLNGVDPPALLGQDEVQTCTNIDFGLEHGGAPVRRGSQLIVAVSTNTAAAGSIPLVSFPSIGYGSPSNTEGLIYANKGPLLYRITRPNVGAPTSTLLGSATGVSAGWVGNVYQGNSYFMGGPGSKPLLMIKDDGANVTDWIKQSPAGTLAITVNTLAPLSVTGTNTFTIVEGVGAVSGGTATATAGSTFRVEFDVAVTGGLNLNGTHTIGDYGVDAVDVWIDDPFQVTNISRDYGIRTVTGTVTNTGFTDYYHTEFNPQSIIDAIGDASNDPETLVESQLNGPPLVIGTTTIVADIDLQTRQQMTQDLRVHHRPASTLISRARQVFNSWIVPRTGFNPVITNPAPGDTWGNVGTARIVIQGTGPFVAKVTKWQITGAIDYSLTDVDLGYAWWETFAAIDPISGGILGESAPSPASARTKISGANVVIASTNTATNYTSGGAPIGHGITHRIFYRQGGYLNAAYAVATTAFGTATVTDTLTDMQALMLNEQMITNITSSPSGFGNVAPRTVSEAWYNRLFILASNTLSWSLPGRPDAFPNTSNVTIGEGGDPGVALVLWPPGLVIINDHSVWEMVGTLFEGDAADFVLTKSGSKHGSKAPLVANLRTPFGIPLIDYDGLYMYVPGQGVEQPMDWVMAKIGDMWRGTGATDPAAYKGNRLPAINMDGLFFACAAYSNNRLYLGLPTGSNNTGFNDTVIVIDFLYKSVTLFQYPWNFNSLYWDQYKNRLYTISQGGNLMAIETGLTDTTESNVAAGITWNFKTRSWATPADVLVENLAVQYRGGQGSMVAIYDQTNTTSVGTLTSSQKIWTQPPLNGSFTTDMVIQAAGVQDSINQQVIYNINWDAFVHPKRVRFYRTDFDDNGQEGEKIWDVHYTDMQIIPSSGTGTVLATSFIDGVVVTTFTLVGDNAATSKQRFTFAFPPETYGNKEYTIYNAQGSTVFKLWDHNNGGRPEPPRVTSYVTDRFATREVWQREWMADMNVLNGTVTATVFVDEVAIMTSTLTGSGDPKPLGREVFRTAFPSEIYGEVVYVRYTSTNVFKHYKTWYIQEPQPDRLLFWETTYDTPNSNEVTKTWLTEMHPLNGTVTGTLFIDGTAVMTNTFTGNKRYLYELGTPNLTVGKTLKVQFSSTTVFKLFNTRVEREPKPFLKKTWNVIYRKPGGATQLDLARFYEIDVESTNTATITSVWYADNTAVSTRVLINPAGSRTYTDRISFPPGIRGYDFQQLMTSSQDFHLWKSNLDIERVGVKGFSRVTYPGTPVDDLKTHEIAQPWSERGPQSG